MPEKALKLIKEENEEQKRKCDNWLMAFQEWTAPRSESPESILFWCGLFALASVLRRRVKISKKYLGGWSCYPSIYCIFVGEQGVIKKSTTIDFAEELLDALDDLNLSKCPEAVTVPDLVKRLQDSDDSSVYMLLSEFSLLPLKAGFGIYDALTKLFDGAKKIDEGTLGRGYVFAANPCLNLLGATTPKWISANVSEDILGGGFGSRVIFIHEQAARQYGLFWGHKIKDIDLDQLRDDLVHDLRLIAQIEGEFEIEGMDTPEDLTKPYGFLDDWYKKNAVAPKGVDPRMVGFYARRTTYILKVAMLVHVARSQEMKLTIEDFKDAIEIMKQVEKKVASTFSNVGKNPYQGDMKGIFDYIKDNPGVFLTQVKARFSHAAEPRKLEELILGLKDAGMIKLDYNSEVSDYTCSVAI